MRKMQNRKPLSTPSETLQPIVPDSMLNTPASGVSGGPPAGASAVPAAVGPAGGGVKKKKGKKKK